MNFIMKLSWSEAKYKSENNALEEKKNRENILGGN